MEDFKWKQRYDLILSVTKPTVDPATGNPTGDLTELACTWWAPCLVAYDWHFTPRINYIVPAILLPDMIMSVGIDPWNAMWYRDPD